MVTSNKPKQEQSGSLALYVDLTTWEFPAIGRHYNPANLVSLVLKGLIFYLALSHLLRDPSSVTPTTFDTEEDLTAPNSSNAWISPTNEPYFQDHAIAQTACLLAFNALGNTLSPSFTLLMSTACWLPETVASDQPTSLPSSQPTSFSDTQFLVNTNTVTNQDNPRIAELVDGGWVIVWMSSLDGSSYGVYARRYWASGMPNGAEFRVNTYTTNDQSYPVVSALQDGGFIIIWQSYGQDNGDGWGIYAQRYTADGLASGAEFRVNTHINSSQRQPAVALLKNGEFIVTWESYLQDGSDYGIYGQRYTANATPVGTEFRINTNTASEQTSSAVASLEDGGFFTAWTTQGQDGSSYGVYAKRYFANGTVLNDDFRVNTYITSEQSSPAVAGLEGGSYVATWISLEEDGSNYGVYAKHYFVNGTVFVDEFRVNTYTIGAQSGPAIAALKGGGYIVLWQSYQQSSSDWSVYGQRYTAMSIKNGAEFRINTYVDTTVFGMQSTPDVIGLADGGFVATWQVRDQAITNWDIYGQRYDSNGRKLGILYPTSQPTGQPSNIPTKPSGQPSSDPSSKPSRRPSLRPVANPSSLPSLRPQANPTGQPSLRPEADPTGQPSLGPSGKPSRRPSLSPISNPSSLPSLRPQAKPTEQPSLRPEADPTGQPSLGPSGKPSRRPSLRPISNPSSLPSLRPQAKPTEQPSLRPEADPTGQPSLGPSGKPSRRPSLRPISNPSSLPSLRPQANPTGQPSLRPEADPTGQPSLGPSSKPSRRPSLRPISNPSSLPSLRPQANPTGQPSLRPEADPTGQPSLGPSGKPSRRPSLRPISNPSSLPSLRPQANPTGQPSLRPEADPTGQPSLGPSGKPSRRPSLSPISNPSSLPSLRPQAKPTEQPSQPPSEKPSTEASAAFLSMFNKTLVPQGLHNVCFLDKRMMTFVHDTYWEFKWNGQLAASISLPYTVTSFTHDGNHSLIVAGVQVNGSSIVSMFDVNIRLETWIQNIPLSTINTLVFEASSQTLFISGIDSNQQLAILNMAMNQSNVNGVSYALSYNSLQPSFSTPTNPADRGMMLSVRALPSLENRVMMVNTMGKAKYIAAISLRNYILQSNAIVAMANNPKSPSSRNIALVGKAIGVNQDNLFYATIVNRLPISATSISISGLRCTAFSEFTDVVLDPSSPDRRILAVGISAGFAPNITQFNSIVIVSLLDFTIDAIRIQLAAGDSVSHCDMNTLSFGFLVQCLVTTAQYQQQTVLLVVTSTLMVPLLPAEYRVFKDVRFSYIDFTATQTTMQAFPWMASSSPSGSPSAGPFAVEPSNAPTDAQSAWSSHSPSALPTNIPSTSVMPTTLYHPSSHPSASQKPSARSPTTVHPTTVKPSTIKPISALPTTWKPSTQKPNTGNPVTALPSSNKPTTRRPTTRHPTTLAPNSAPPSTMPSTIDISNIPTNSMEEEPSPSPTRAPSVSHQTSDSSNLFLGAIIILGVIFGCGVLCFLYESLSLINDKKKIKPERPDAPKLDALGEEKKEEEIKESESITQESAPIIDNDNASKHSHGGSSDKHSRQLSSRHKSRFFMSSDNLSSISYASAPESSCMSGAYSPRFLMFSADQSDNRSQDSLSVHEKKRSHSGLTEKSPEHSSDDLSVNFDLYGTDQLDRLMSEEDFVIDAYVDSF